MQVLEWGLFPHSHSLFTTISHPESVISISTTVFFFQYRIPCQERRTKKDGKDTLFSSAYFKALTKKSGRIAGSSPKDAMMSLKVTKEAVPFA